MEDVIRTALTDILETLGISGVDFTVEHPGEINHGDYTANVALVAAKQLGQSPRAVAEQICAALDGQIEYVDRIEIAGPGFINFYLARDFFTAELGRVQAQRDAWGRGNSWAGKKVVVEYTDPNPFKEFHIGHLFTNAVGESIARLFMMAGADVKRVCYQGDVGLHVAYAIWGLMDKKIKSTDKFTPKDLGSAYASGASAAKASGAFTEEMRIINTFLYLKDENSVKEQFVNYVGINDFDFSEILALYDAGRAVSLAYFETIYDAVGTKFDDYFFESEVASRGKELVLSHPDIFPESEGAHIYEGEKYGLHTRVFLNKLGLPTYEAKELALAKVKEERLGKYDHSVISTAKEINEYFKVLKSAMGFVYPELAAKTEHIGHGMVRLTTGKMSSRTGDVIPALEFIADVSASAAAKVTSSGVVEVTTELSDAIALGAIKYATLRGSILQDSVFDKDKALSFEGDSGPYLQYTHARILSVLEKAQQAGLSPSTAVVPESIYPVEHLLYRFPEVVAKALDERAPHKVVGYLTELAGSFNTFYANEKIADANDVYASYKAAVAEAVAITLKNGLWVLGIKAPERL